jgi:sugar phosphate isomerase/epimerase
MSTSPTRVESAVASCRPSNVEPVELSASSLSTTAPEYLRELKAELAAEGYQPAELVVTACFSEDCSIATQEEADRLRDLVRAGAFLGVGVVRVEIEDLRNPEKVRPALSALEERARREGVTLSVDGLDVSA